MAFDSSKRYHVTALACAVASALSLNASVVQAQEEAEIKEEDVEKMVVTVKGLNGK